MGGGGGGAAIRTDNVFNFAGDVVRAVASGGLDNASDGDVAGVIEESVTGEKAKAAMAGEAKKAETKQAQNEAKLAEQEANMKLAKDAASKRARQKALGGGRGRSSTILTSPLGGTPADAAASSGKTLLGS